MDVTCERCGTEYDFDETLVSDRGTTVKCTHCGHMFKVHRPGAGSGEEESRPWQVMRGDGTAEPLGSLRELQRRITEGLLTEDDQITRSGESWKRLGDIAELQTFFAAAQAATSTESGPRRTRQGTILEGAASRATPPADAQPAPELAEPGAGATRRDPTPAGSTPGPASPRPEKRTLIGVGAKPPAVPSLTGSPAPGGHTSTPRPGATPPPGPAPGAARRAPGSTPAPGPGAPASTPPPARRAPASSPPAAGAGWMEGPGMAADATAPSGRAAAERAETMPEGSLRAPASRPPPARAAPPSYRPAPISERPLYVDEHDEPARPRRRSRIGLWLTLLVVGASAGGVAWGWDRVAPLVGLAPPADPLARFIDRAEAALALDHEEGYAEALREYTRATAIDENAPRILVGLARTHATWAQALRFRASDLEARTPEQPALAGEASSLRREAQEHADQALRYSERAVGAQESSAEAGLVLADAMRLAGRLKEARRTLDGALARMGKASPEALYVRALVSVAEAGDDIAAALPDATRSIERGPELVRGRLLAARALLAAGNVEEARKHLDSVLDRVPDHPRAEWLKDAVERGVPPAHPVVAVLDGGLADAAAEGGAAAVASTDVGESRTQEKDRAASSEAVARRRETSRPAGGGVPQGRDYDWYVSRGDQLLEVGDVGGARAMFERALEDRPGSPAALTGLGYVALNMGDTRSAVRRFEPAAHAGYAPAYIGLGNAYQGLGRPGDALEAFRGYLNRLPNGPEANVAMTHIERIERSQEAEQQAADDRPQRAPPEDAEPDAQPSEAAPSTAPDELPAPRATTPETTPPASDPPAIGSEP